jgi:(2R)-sulfolactate sulfo-lyase subunit alpha
MNAVTPAVTPIVGTPVAATKKLAQAILLHPKDTILVCVSPIHAGDSVLLDGQAVTINTAIDVGHKIARCALALGDKVFRYGAPIGSMTQAATAGEHVHLHNMQSDYIPSHTRTRQNQLRSES